MNNLYVWEVTICGDWERDETTEYQASIWLPTVKKYIKRRNIKIHKLTMNLGKPIGTQGYASMMIYTAKGRVELTMDVVAENRESAFRMAEARVKQTLQESGMCGLPTIYWDRHE